MPLKPGLLGEYFQKGTLVVTNSLWLTKFFSSIFLSVDKIVSFLKEYTHLYVCVCVCVSTINFHTWKPLFILSVP